MTSNTDENQAIQQQQHQLVGQALQPQLTPPNQASIVTNPAEKWGPPKPGEMPVDFVKRILSKGGSIEQPLPPSQVQAMVGPQPKPPTVEDVISNVRQTQETANISQQPQEKKEPGPQFDFNKKEEPDIKNQLQGTQPILEPQAPTVVDDDKEPEGSLSANYKLLKSHYKETKSNLQKTSEEKAKLAEELEKYKNGVVVPEILQQKENEIQRLSTYEKLFNVKSSKAYKEQVVEPLSQKDRELKQLFKDYEIPEEEAAKFASISNRADRNRFLSEHFDSRGADQVERILNDTFSIREKAKAIEAGSSNVIQELERQQQDIEAERESQRLTSIKASAEDSWIKSLLKIRSENQIKEIIPKANDPEFNERIVTPILTAASTEYGKCITYLAKSGLKELKPELAEYFVKMSILAHTSAVASKTRDAALEHAKEMETATRVGNGFFRPQIGGGIPSIASTAPSKQTLEQGIDGILKTVLSKQ